MIKKYNTASELINDYSILHYPTLIYEEETGYVGIKNQDNICIYTTSDDKILTFYDDALKYISSHTYENGIGKIIIKDNQLPYTTLIFRLDMCGSNLKTVILPRNLKIINDTSFRDLPNLEQIIIPYGLKEIYGVSFKNCPKLTKLTIPDSVLHIEGLEYSNALYNNENYNKNGLFKINNHIIEYINNDVEHLEIPEGIVSVNCIRSTSLKSITFPPSVKYIANISCENLESVTFSEGLIAASGYDLFENCLSLKTIEFPASFRGFMGLDVLPFSNSGIETVTFRNLRNPLVSLFSYSNVSSFSIKGSPYVVYDNGVYKDTADYIELIIACKGTTIRFDTTKLGFMCFGGIKGINTIIIPKSMKQLGDLCFAHSDIDTIEYEGTKDQWETIIKDSTWNRFSNITKIICTDGEISL